MKVKMGPAQPAQTKCPRCGATLTSMPVQSNCSDKKCDCSIKIVCVQCGYIGE